MKGFATYAKTKTKKMSAGVAKICGKNKPIYEIVKKENLEVLL